MIKMLKTDPKNTPWLELFKRYYTQPVSKSYEILEKLEDMQEQMKNFSIDVEVIKINQIEMSEV